MSTSLCLIVALATTGVGPTVDSELLKIARERTAIQSWEVIIRTKMVLQKPLVELADAAWEVHYWRDTDGSFRLDRRKVEPRKTEDRDHRDNFAFDGSVFRAIKRKDILTYNLEYRSKKPWFTIEKIDPRLLGVVFQPMELFHHVQYLDIERIANNAKSVQRIKREDETSEIFKHDHGLEYKYVFDGDGKVIRYSSISMDSVDPRMTSSARLEYQSSLPGAERFPTFIEYKVYAGGKLTIHENVEIDWLKVNESFNKSIYDWSQLEVPIFSPLIVDDEYKHDDKDPIWDGTSFQNPLTVRARQAKRSYSTLEITYWAAAIVGGICLIIALGRFAARTLKA